MFIESFDHKGRGMARINEKITFVQNAIPGEDVEIKITKEKKKYNEAVITSINKYSKNRVEPACPYYFFCGGCHLQHISYKHQLQFKQDKISNIIERYLNKSIKVNNIIFDQQFGYRNKLTLQVDKEIGLYKENTNDLIKINSCLLCNQQINERISYLQNLNLNKIKQIIIRCTDEEVILIIIGDKKLDVKPISDYFDNIIIKDDQYYVKKGNNNILKRINNLTYKISLDSFFQVNYKIMIKLYDEVKKYCRNSKRVLDLYCGTGSISLYISDVVSHVDGVEINKNAIMDANENKKNDGISNVFFACSDTKDIAIENEYDTIIVDPPRSGLNKHIINEILMSNCSKIIYISCDPMTMVRDLKDLESKYELVEVTPFDMFPNTYHVECVCVLKLR